MAAPEQVLTRAPAAHRRQLAVAAAWVVGALAAGLMMNPLLGVLVAVIGAVQSRHHSRALTITLASLAVLLLAFAVVFQPTGLSFGGPASSEDGGTPP